VRTNTRNALRICVTDAGKRPLVTGARGTLRVSLVAGVMTLTLGSPSAAWAATKVPEQDKLFLQSAHQTHLTAIAAGKLAEHKSITVPVRDFGIRLVVDHSEMDEAVRRTAKKLRVSLPDDPNETQRATLEQLQAADGTEFAVMFVLSQQEEHMRARQSAEFEAANRRSDSRAKRVAKQSLPMLQAHEDALRELAKNLGLSTSASPSPQPAEPDPQVTEVPPAPPPRRGNR